MLRRTPHVFGTHDAGTIDQIHHVADAAAAAALMADGHVGPGFPVGGVAAYRGQTNILGVGVDIGCGNAALRLTTMGAALDARREALADAIMATISFGVGRSNLAQNAPVDHPLFADPAWDVIRDVAGADAMERLRDNARAQLGTVGGGNHYVDVFADEADHVWVGVHFGSRGLGHHIAMGTLALAKGAVFTARLPEYELILSLGTELGAAYWAMMTLAGQYAMAGREWVTREVARLIGGDVLDAVHNNHNFAWAETHDIGEGPEELIVVRKGATPAFPGQRGFVGGSMGDPAVILEGTRADALVDAGDPSRVETITALQRAALYSTVHGAGRVMSRNVARGKLKGRGKKARLVSPGLISPAMLEEWMTKADVVRRGGDLDEAPQAYRRLHEVLPTLGDTITVQHTLRPRIVCMAPRDVYDPFKD